MADPATLPVLDDWNATQLAKAKVLLDHKPSGVQCPKSVTELLDVPGTESAAQVGELLLTLVQVVCPECGFTGERYL